MTPDPDAMRAVARATPQCVVLVLGDESYIDAPDCGLRIMLDRINDRPGIAIIIYGDRPGADAVAKDWATTARASHFVRGLSETPGDALPLRHEHKTSKDGDAGRFERMLQDAAAKAELGYRVVCVATPERQRLAALAPGYGLPEVIGVKP